MVEVRESILKTTSSAWISEDSHVLEKIHRMQGNLKLAIFYRTRSIVLWDRNMRSIEAKISELPKEQT